MLITRHNCEFTGASANIWLFILIFAYYFYFVIEQLRTEFNIARRLSSRRGGARAGIMERVAVVATAISVTVIIVTLSVVVGFKRDISTLVSSVASDIVVTSPYSSGVVSNLRIERGGGLESMLREDSRISHISPFTAKEGVVKSGDNVTGLLLKGVDTTFRNDAFRRALVAGEMPRIGGEPRTKDILISESIAKKMDVEVGERIEMIFLDDDGSVIRDRFAISGIYHTGFEPVDNSIAITDMRNVAREYDGNANLITGYEVWLNDPEQRGVVCASLSDNFVELYLTEGVDVEPFAIDELYIDIFGWLATHDTNALVIIVIMLVVALLNITTALLINVLERQRMIGELRALGMPRSSIVGIFLFRVLFVIGRGMAWGIALGITIAVVQHLWAVVPLPSAGYILATVPAALCWVEWGIAIAATIIVAMVVMLLPALLAARVSPAKAIRYE